MYKKITNNTTEKTATCYLLGLAIICMYTFSSHGEETKNYWGASKKSVIEHCSSFYVVLSVKSIPALVLLLWRKDEHVCDNLPDCFLHFLRNCHAEDTINHMMLITEETEDTIITKMRILI